MITQELIDYVKTQLASGITREKVTSDLLGQGGWTMEQINEVFASTSGVPVSPNDDMTSELVENKYWSKWIPAVNRLFLLGVLVMMFVVNIFILITDSLGLGFETMIVFYGIMLIPTAVFVSFYFYEKRTLADKYTESNSRLDPWLLTLITIRNIAFVASVIPFIQIIGMVALVFGGVPYLIVYYFMLRTRNKSVVAV